MSGNTVAEDARLQGLDIYRCYKNSKYLSIKHSSYFQVYEDLLSKYRGKKIVFVEIGVLNGGSLFMWREFFGPEARIIGIEFNPAAKKWEQEGFEIFIGSQSDPAFWDAFFSSVGDVDVVVDDGGHTNEQQIVTANLCIPHIRDGGLLIVEDTHTSYFKSFGNPSKYSFVNYAKSLVDSLNSRQPTVRASSNDLNRAVYSMGFYESMVSFHVDRTKCFVPTPVSNEGITSDAVEYRDRGSLAFRLNSFLGGLFGHAGIKFSAMTLLRALETRWVNWRLKRFFR